VIEEQIPLTEDASFRNGESEDQHEHTSADD